MKKIYIRKNVSIPEKIEKATCKRSKYPFSRMKPTDSFVVTSKSGRAVGLASQLKWKREKEYPNEKYVVRMLDCNNKTAGVWRVK